MPADDILAADAPLVNVAVAVDEIVVADVAPPLVDRVVVVDGTDGYDRILRVGRLGVVNDDMVEGNVLRRPDLAVLVGAIALVRAPLRARHKLRGHRIIGGRGRSLQEGMRGRRRG